MLDFLWLALNKLINPRIANATNKEPMAIKGSELIEENNINPQSKPRAMDIWMQSTQFEENIL